MSVDEPNAAMYGTGIYTSWTEDNTSIYSEYCEYTAIPDASFEAFLSTITLEDGVTLVDDIPNDGQVPTVNAEQVTRLRLRGYRPKLTNVTGIDAFVNLVLLDLVGHDVTSIDVSKNTELEQIWLNFNEIRVVDFSNNMKLRTTDLQSIRELETLIYPETTDITYIDVRDSKLTEFDLTQHPKLRTLLASGAPLLQKVEARGTTATRINLTACNSLSCVAVDNVQSSN